jgi:hypothetical protein
LDDDPVIAGEYANDLALLPLRQEFNAHSGIIIVTLFGSGYAGLGKIRKRVLAGKYLISDRSWNAQLYLRPGSEFTPDLPIAFRTAWLFRGFLASPSAPDVRRAQRRFPSQFVLA